MEGSCQRMSLRMHLLGALVEQLEQLLLIPWPQVLRGGRSPELDVICLFITAINPIAANNPIGVNNAIEPNQSSAHQ